MDLATLIGILAAVGIVLSAIAIGPSPLIFVNIPSIFIVIGGTFGATLMQFNLPALWGGFGVAMKAFFHKKESRQELIQEGLELSQIARKEGLLGLEGREISNKFLQTGITLAVDGHDPELVRRMLSKDINLTIERHEEGQQIFKAIADMAPAMGMIGTLIGLVQMLSNMSDPKQIGPAMAVALLTTLYGAFIANVICLPISKKLGLRSREERINRSLILEEVGAIQEGMNPRVMEELLKTYLPPSERENAAAAA